jgi:hypothetical protein
MGDPNSKVNGILESLPLDHLISAPLMSACAAQVQLSKATCDFVKQMGFDADGNVQMISMQMNEKDASGNINEIEMNVPLLTILNVPSMQLQTVNIDLVVEVDAMSAVKNTSSSEKTSAFGVKTSASWSGWFGTRFSAETTYNTTAKLSSSTSNNDKLNTKAKYQVSIVAENKQPVGLTKILDRLISNDKLVPAPP